MSRPLVNLTKDTVFIEKMKAIVRSAGLMKDPHFKVPECQLVEGNLTLDLLNVWHETHQGQRPNADEYVECWLRPKHLGHACYYGRVDVVEAAIKAGRPLDGQDYRGNPIAAAFEAFVTTKLHLRCIELLFEAGARPSLLQFRAYQVESMGREIDAAMMAVLVRYAERSDDAALRERAALFKRSS